ncbi:MAG: tryptophan synthase subunit alpha [Gammaproteobacteria bacterium]|nr:tryptophan synthase subunit alpha [Gammaproteobacteria bacterium]
MSRISAIASKRLQQKKKLLIPYLVAGDPDLPTTLALMHELVNQGADIIELGIPFSDPASDGPVIQEGIERALTGGTTLRDTLAIVTQFRQRDSETGIVLMGYLNPIEIMGYEEFVGSASAAGVDGVLVVDMPPVESTELQQRLSRAAIDTIYLVAPTTSKDRAKRIVNACSGYLYYVSLKGVTGAAITDFTAIRKSIDALRLLTDLPVVVGFGIKDSESARAMGLASDGIIIGSALVEQIAKLSSQAAQVPSLAECCTVIGKARIAIDTN